MDLLMNIEEINPRKEYFLFALLIGQQVLLIRVLKNQRGGEKVHFFQAIAEKVGRR